jgi:hypothetical protein
MSTCFGASAVELANTQGQLPVLACVGNHERVQFSQSLVAFVVFYNVLARGGNIAEAVETMNAATRSSTFEWHDART